MKFYLLALIVLLCSCNSGSSTPEKTVVVDSNAIFIDSAKYYLSKSNEFIKLGISKEMKQEAVSDSINPLMDKYFSVFKKIKAADTSMINEFRIKKINELIEYKIKFDKK